MSIQWFRASPTHRYKAETSVYHCLRSVTVLSVVFQSCHTSGQLNTGVLHQVLSGWGLDLTGLTVSMCVTTTTFRVGLGSRQKRPQKVSSTPQVASQRPPGGLNPGRHRRSPKNSPNALFCPLVLNSSSTPPVGAVWIRLSSEGLGGLET